MCDFALFSFLFGLVRFRRLLSVIMLFGFFHSGGHRLRFGSDRAGFQFAGRVFLFLVLGAIVACKTGWLPPHGGWLRDGGGSGPLERGGAGGRWAKVVVVREALEVRVCRVSWCWRAPSCRGRRAVVVAVVLELCFAASGCVGRLGVEARCGWAGGGGRRGFPCAVWFVS